MRLIRRMLMWIYVRVQEKESYYNDGPEGRVKARLEQASGERCLIVPYREFNMSVLKEFKPRAVVMSGFGGHFQARKIEWFSGMHEVLHNADLPILGICGSHQLMGFAFTMNFKKTRFLKDQPMRKLGIDEDLPRCPRKDPKHDTSSFFVANGFFPIKRTKDDPLFRGLPQLMMMRCNHYCEVKRLPPGFVGLAKSGHCRIEAMRHKERTLYGVQFHPEAYEDPFFHGRKLLENFAGIAAEFWRKKKSMGRVD